LALWHFWKSAAKPPKSALAQPFLKVVKSALAQPFLKVVKSALAQPFLKVVKSALVFAALFLKVRGFAALFLHLNTHG
jgi:hypothetical protein